MINLELYKIFYVVAIEKNVTKASGKLGISQPAVTKHIKNLEYQIGSPLFIRTKKGVVLNEYGEKIFLKVKNALALLNECENEINESKKLNKGYIKIGTSSSLARKYLLPHLKVFHELYPNITIDILTNPTIELIRDLKNGNIDLIISKFPKTIDLDLEYIKLGDTKYIFVAGEKYKSLKNRKINIKDLIKYPMLFQKKGTNSRMSIDRYLKENNIMVEPKINVGSSNLLIDLVSIGYGFGYCTELYAKEKIKMGKIFKIDVYPSLEKVDFGLIFLKNNVMMSYSKKFVDFLKNVDK